jgi:DNA topoisomerase-1
MKKNPIVQRIFKKYDLPISRIDEIDIDFADMDVSAKTKNGKIFLNARFIEDDGDFDEDHYLPHELTHYCQQVTDSLKEDEMKKDYLDNRHEQEAFGNQVAYKADTEGKQEAERYVEQVLDHHSVKGKKRKKKRDELLSRAAKNHRYVGKKVEESGNVTYIYDEKHVEERNKKKAQRVEKLRKMIKKVRSQVKKDIIDDNPRVKLPAIAVALIDETYERVGNRKSARELGHYGVTEWLVKHVKFSKDKATLNYIGKSGVRQKKEITNRILINQLKELAEDKKGSEQILSIENFSLNDNHVNHYLRPFEITAKDIRGFHANEEMIRGLKKAPKEEDEKKLKEQFKKILEETAKIVGHEPSTLKNQYLVPGLEERYLKSGKV